MTAQVSHQELQSELAGLLIQSAPRDAAAIMERATADESAAVLSQQPAHAVAGLLKHVSQDAASALLGALEPELLGRVVALGDPGQTAALLARLPDDARERSLKNLDDDVAKELRVLMSYPRDSAGGLMDARATSFRGDVLVSDVLQALRGLEGRRVQDIFVVDEEHRLIASAPILEVMLAAPDRRLDTITKGPPVSVTALSPRDDVVTLLEEARVGSVPVVDFHGRLVGVLRQTALIAAAQDAAASIALSMVGASGEERALGSPLVAIKKRLPWLQVNLVTAFIAAAVVGLFEDTIAKVTALAILLPVVAGQSGNTGAQALAVTMRGLALREIRPRHFLPVLLKEGAAAAGNGVAVALTTSLAVYLWSNSYGLTLVIGVSMVISMTMAGLAGASIPIILIMLKQDPAQSSSIILTTITDVAGFFSFLGIATALISML